MTVIKKSACAGSLESSDVFVEIFPAEELSLKIESTVAERFGKAIEKAVREELAKLCVEKASVRVSDRGALDCVIKARIETAVKRAEVE